VLLHGAVFYFLSGQSTLSSTRDYFLSNKAGSYGSILLSTASAQTTIMNLTSSNFELNTALDMGGIYLQRLLPFFNF